jgi:ATP-dependent Clp protease ATP-binding subunit ClpC
MFERYTVKARRTIFFARYEAVKYGSHYIESHHLLLGILHVENQLAAVFIKDVNEAAALRREIESQIEIGPRLSDDVVLPLSAESGRILNHAAREADEMRRSHISTGHLLLGMLDEPQSLAARILANHQVDEAKVRQAVASSPP